MTRQITTVVGSISQVVMAEGLPVRLDPPGRSVSLVGQSVALVVLEADSAPANLLVLGPAGDVLARLGTTCGTGQIDEVLEVQGELRVIESTPGGDYQARFDVASLTLERLGE